MVPDGVRTPQDPPEASEGPRGHFAFLSLKPYNMGVYGLLWTQLGHRYRYLGTTVLYGSFQYLLVLFCYFFGSDKFIEKKSLRGHPLHPGYPHMTTF